MPRKPQERALLTWRASSKLHGAATRDRKFHFGFVRVQTQRMSLYLAEMSHLTRFWKPWKRHEFNLSRHQTLPDARHYKREIHTTHMYVCIATSLLASTELQLNIGAKFAWVKPKDNFFRLLSRNYLEFLFRGAQTFFQPTDARKLPVFWRGFFWQSKFKGPISWFSFSSRTSVQYLAWLIKKPQKL